MTPTKKEDGRGHTWVCPRCRVQKVVWTMTDQDYCPNCDKKRPEKGAGKDGDKDVDGTVSR